MIHTKEYCNIKKHEKEYSSLQELKIVPFEGGTEETRKLFSYFLHCAPDIESEQSVHIPAEFHAEIFDLMFRDRHFMYSRFCFSNTPIEKELAKHCLAGDRLCLKCKRYVCKRNPTQQGKQKETDLDCFLRHIRNAIAHGRVYYCDTGNRSHVIFEDENKTGNLSARIVCIKADLKHWKKILSDKQYYSK